MIKLIAGEKGSGKSKNVVKEANNLVEEAKGSFVFIDDDNRIMYELNHKIRFINISEFPVETTSEFLGFVCGLISNNYDIERIYVDGIFNTESMKEEEMVKWFEEVEKLSDTFDVNFIVTLTYDEQLPEKLKKYIA